MRDGRGIERGTFYGVVWYCLLLELVAALGILGYRVWFLWTYGEVPHMTLLQSFTLFH